MATKDEDKSSPKQNEADKQRQKFIDDTNASTAVPEKAPIEQVVAVAKRIDKGEDPVLAAAKEDPTDNGPSDLMIAAAITGDAESAISTNNQNKAAHGPVADIPTDAGINPATLAVGEELGLIPSGAAKLQQFLEGLPEDTPDSHTLFGLGGVGFTVGDLRSLKGAKRK